MQTSSTPRRYFTRQRFATAALIQFGVFGAIQGFWYVTGGASTATAFAVLLALLWINLCVAVRWRTLGKQELSGELSMEDYRANPNKYSWASKKHWRITVWGGVLVLGICVLVSMLLGA
jgi:hypothetical protein